MKILVVAGEESGDLHGASLAREIRRREPGCRLIGVGGNRMAEAGVELLLRMEEIAVLGFAEVLLRLRELRRAWNTLRSFIRREKPDLFVPIDYPGMNLRLAREARRLRIPVVYFISPQVWAWGKWRVKEIRQSVDRMLVILPFEEKFYRKEGVPVTFVGHPLLDTAHPSLTREEFRRRNELPLEEPLVALLPGSRAQEVRRMFPVMQETAGLLRSRRKVSFVVAAASGDRRQEIVSMMGEEDSSTRVVLGQTYEAIAAADIALVASGTATLECACLGTPMVVVYRVAPLSWWIARNLVRVPHVAMANLIAGRRLVPELLQGQVRPERAAAELEALLADDERRTEMRRGLGEVRAALGETGAAGRAADAVLRTLAPGKGPAVA